jgi:hypothetical protein
MDAFSWDGDPEVYTIQCEWCGISHPSSRGFVLRDQNAHAIFHTEWHPSVEVGYVEITTGSFSEPDYEDQTTFGIQVGPQEEDSDIAARLIQAQRGKGNPVFGRHLTREEALQSPRLEEVWKVFDWLVDSDPILQHNLMHRRWFRASQ